MYLREYEVFYFRLFVLGNEEFSSWIYQSELRISSHLINLKSYVFSDITLRMPYWLHAKGSNYERLVLKLNMYKVKSWIF